MGVNGLWTVVQPCARPTNLATLNRKRLAVDASIWIYQFLKAVRDKEGNALRNSHVVGFFRRICKLLWFGIRPVFVFDGGAPALKRQTIRSRKQRREGRREDAVRTAGKLLAVQMQRMIEEEDEKRKRRKEQREPEREEPTEEIPDADKLVYVDELGMSQTERQKNRKFYKQDAYHLPDLDSGIHGMGQPDDPRIMSIEELEDYARQFNSGEDINVYDFSKIDFEGEFFKSLPPVDRYNILNAARIRSRLRMGLSKEQLDGMFPDRMAFSRFQIERVRERNHLTQRLMQEAGMTGTDLTLAKNARIAGEKDREYILVKNDGAEGGWALGVISKERDYGEMHKPIDVDALDFQYQNKEEDDEWEDDDFEDVPIEGVNRLPKVYSESQAIIDDDEDSLFVGGNTTNDVDGLFEAHDEGGNLLVDDEEEDLNRAIALSLRNQHGVTSKDQQEVEEEEEEAFEDVPVPEWTQKAVEQSKPISSTSGSMIAHIVNNRANAAVSRPAPRPALERRVSNGSSDSDIDLRAALSSKRKKKVPVLKQVTPAVSNVKNPFDGPLPFEKLDWKSSIFARKDKQVPSKAPEKEVNMEPNSDDELAGGFVRDDDESMAKESKAQESIDHRSEESRPLPPWMMQNDSDIRDSLKAQRVIESEINEQDREAAFEEEKWRRKEAIIEIESSDDESDVQIIEAPPQRSQKTPTHGENRSTSRLSPATLIKINPPIANEEGQTEDTRRADAIQEQTTSQAEAMDETVDAELPSKPASPEPEFEEVEIMQPPDEPGPIVDDTVAEAESPEPVFEDVDAAVPKAVEQPDVSETIAEDDANEVIFGDDFDDNEFSDPEEEELLVQMAEEAQEHARFASQLNHKSEKENQEAYEQELKALRSQQKKDRRDADEVTQVMITECQALLRFFGIPYITAPMEAEAQCAELVKLGLVDGIVTDDSDTFLFGGTRVYKNMFNSNKFVECYLGSDLEKELSLSREQLISLAQLLGSDYTEGLPGVGPVTAVEILSEFPGRDGLAEFKEWWQDVQINSRPKEADQKSVFRRKFRKSQGTKLFLPPGFPSPAVFEAYLHPEVDSDAEQFQWGVPDVAGLRQFLMSTIGWSEDRTDEVLVPVIRDMNRREAEGTQSNITRYFEGSVGVGAKEAFAPRQRAQASKRMAQAVNKLRAKAVVDGIPVAAEAADLATPEEETPALPSGRRKRKATKTITIDDDDDDDYADGEVNGVDNGQDKDNGTGVQKAAGRQKGKGVKRGKRAKASA
ncbi:PIN domain-like protein [Annulohypoxylon maeteangense]|uniref:PIN domain-like protein n=1 Tax=Annulohypoxylon maeteangense TaxID=1927788 RepID=UPI0020086256|nr:PIN domain-like protein [Annulohypoxylon maeteangense]KAI0882164.1 PIN domain-like protein [Annulohypoxylon maeteangense]